MKPSVKLRFYAKKPKPNLKATHYYLIHFLLHMYCKMTNALLTISNHKLHYVSWQHCLVFCHHHHKLQHKSNKESNAGIMMSLAFAHSAFFCHNFMWNSLVMNNCEQFCVRRIISAGMMCAHYNT
jgi:hypothetical protein